MLNVEPLQAPDDEEVYDDVSSRRIIPALSLWSQCESQTNVYHEAVVVVSNCARMFMAKVNNHLVVLTVGEVGDQVLSKLRDHIQHVKKGEGPTPTATSMRKTDCHDASWQHPHPHTWRFQHTVTI